MNEHERTLQEYEDILSLPHHVSEKRPRMSTASRAAQFLPFAALSGYDAAVKETARLTDERVELSEDALAVLCDRFRLLTEHLRDAPEVTITYFRADPKKNGGAYESVRGVVKKVDEYERLLQLQSGQRIAMDDVYALDGDLFDHGGRIDGAATE